MSTGDLHLSFHIDSKMMNVPIKLEDDDGRWSHLPDVGMVRSGPREGRHHNQDTLSQSITQRVAHTRAVSPDRGALIASQQHTRTSRPESVSSGRLGDDERSIVKTEDGTVSDALNFNFREYMSLLFTEQNRQQNSGGTAITQVESVHNDFSDNRRNRHHLPSRRSRPTFTPEPDRSLFFPESSPSSRQRPASTIPEDQNRRKRRRSDSETPPPPEPPPNFRSYAPKGCRCPVGFQCPKKSNLKSDCRTLTAVFRRWQRGGRQVNVNM